MVLRQKIYHALVNRHPGISYRYHKIHDGTAGMLRIASWAYLLWINFAYYILFCHFLGRVPQMDIYEEKRLNIKESESAAYRRENPELGVEEYIQKIRDYDIISFDVFDTLIFRPVAQPTDVFYLIGEKLGILDFKNIRIRAEWDAREKCHARYGHTEVSLEDIWKRLEQDAGLPAGEGIRLEQEIEKKLCYANPFMLEVWKRLREMDKKIIVVSDMYLPEDCIVDILETSGYTGAEKVYISNVYHKNKAGGKLYEAVIGDWYGSDAANKNGFSIVHIGDNPHSDVEMAKKNGMDVLPYQNINKNMLLYRPMDMSYLIGSAYRGIVSGHLYSGWKVRSMEYEYGYIYGGLFATGYCSFLHDYYRKNHVDKLLFLSRDGDILKQVYELLYPEDAAVYVYWSRKAAVKLMADYDRHDYFRRFIYHKINQEYTIRQTLHAMELDWLADELGDWKDIWTEWRKGLEQDRKIEKDFSGKMLAKQRKKKFIDIGPEDELTHKNGDLLRKFIEAKWDRVIKSYASQQKAAGMYYKKTLEGCDRAAAVDIGWAGSGAIALSYLVDNVWKIPCEITGVIAGTNTVHNAEPDAAEPFLQSGRLTAYLYSQSHNRDLLKKHDPKKDYNVFWELLLSSPTPQFTGFDLDGNGEVTLNFGKYDANQDGIREIQQGILDFARQYRGHFKEFPCMFHISGRDAYAPMLVAAGRSERYLKAMEKKFCLEINVD